MSDEKKVTNPREIARLAIEKAIKKVDANITKIESVHDINQLPLILVKEVYRLSEIIEEYGTSEALRFASDSKRRLLDSLIKGKALVAKLPNDCRQCPNWPQRSREITEDRKDKDSLVKALKLTKKQYKVLENHIGPART